MVITSTFNASALHSPSLLICGQPGFLSSEGSLTVMSRNLNI